MFNSEETDCQLEALGALEAPTHKCNIVSLRKLVTFDWKHNQPMTTTSKSVEGGGGGGRLTVVEEDNNAAAMLISTRQTI